MGFGGGMLLSGDIQRSEGRPYLARLLKIREGHPDLVKIWRETVCIQHT